MKRYRLAEKITIEGDTWFGRSSTLILEPHWKSDSDEWYFDGPYEGTPITLDMLSVLPGLATGRTITLDDKGRRLHEFEHIAWLHALGLRGVHVYVYGSNWPPYMCSGQLFERVRRNLIPDGELKPYLPAIPQGRFSLHRREAGIPRWIGYKPVEGRLNISAIVNYPQLEVDGAAYFELSRDMVALPVTRLQHITTARSLGKPAALRWVAGAATRSFGWPHSDKLLWLRNAKRSSKEGQNAFCVELARHQILDTVGVFSLIASPEKYFSGDISLRCCSHTLALEAARGIAALNTERATALV